MRTALARSSWFALAVLVVLVAWELASLEMPVQPPSGDWKERGMLHVILITATAVGAFLGGLPGFRLLPAKLVFSRWHLCGLAVLFALISSLSTGALLKLGENLVTFVSGMAVLSAILVQTMGRLLARIAISSDL
ncbi:hypothetical protein [Variovorax sp. PAMC26660]|uniref:hypothetical protein n=1 Tax=Variovorax sp. PAMC26660 TaxID=2762322 RepID=UPI00164E5A18|nr:hypothetical protein [Variovorax sp. PAMC26660]QNK66557.1 hypothetical protein H7F35_25710 [Variovorax sp. PAMC26660]